MGNSATADEQTSVWLLGRCGDCTPDGYPHSTHSSHARAHWGCCRSWIKSLSADFTMSDFLMAEGQQRLGMVHESGAQMASGILLLQGVKLMKDGWTENQYMREFNNRAALGGKEIASPLLIIHGEADERLDVGETTRAVERSVEACPTTSIEYIVLPGVAHTPALTASQRIWMDWIADTFAGREIQAGYRKVMLKPAKPIPSYQAEQNWYVAPATQSYHAP